MFRWLRLRLKIVVPVIVVLVLAVIGYVVFVRKDSNSKVEPITEEALSALNTANQSVKNGINSDTAEDALYIASNMINTGKTAEARDYVASIDDTILSNVQITSKYTILLDSYRMENNKDGFTKTVDSYKSVVESRNDPTLTESLKYLTPAYIDAVFTAPASVPVEQEIP